MLTGKLESISSFFSPARPAGSPAGGAQGGDPVDSLDTSPRGLTFSERMMRRFCTRNASSPLTPLPAEEPPSPAPCGTVSTAPQQVNLDKAMHQLFQVDAMDLEPDFLWNVKIDSEHATLQHTRGKHIIATNVSHHGAENDLTAYDPNNNGRVAWVYKAPAPVTSSPFCGSAAIYMGEQGRGVVALDESTGKELMTFKTARDVVSRPCEDEKGRLFCADKEGCVYAFDARSGARLWARQLEETSIRSDVIVDNDMVIINDSKGTFHAFDADGGELKWCFNTGIEQEYTSYYGAASGTFFTRVKNDLDTLYGIDTKTGSLSWKFKGKNWIKSTGTDEKTGRIYVGSGKTLHALDARTGKQEWALTSPGGDMDSAPVNAGNGLLYIHNEFTDRLYDLGYNKLDALLAVKEDTGAVQWITRFDRNGPMYKGSPLLDDYGDACIGGFQRRSLTSLRPPTPEDPGATPEVTPQEPERLVDVDDEWLTIDDVRIRRKAMELAQGAFRHSIL